MIVGVIGISRRICIIELSDRQINRELMKKGRYEQLQNVCFFRGCEKSLLFLGFVVSRTEFYYDRVRSMISFLESSARKTVKHFTGSAMYFETVADALNWIASFSC